LWLGNKDMSVEYVDSSKGKDLIVHLGYIFEKDYTRKENLLETYKIQYRQVDGYALKIMKLFFVKTSRPWSHAESSRNKKRVSEIKATDQN